MTASSQYPPTVVDKILEVTLRSNRYAYLAVDETGALVNKGGDTAGDALAAADRAMYAHKMATKQTSRS